MKQEKSAFTDKPYSVRMILSVAELSSAAWYDNRPRVKKEEKRKPGRKPSINDDELLDQIKAYLRKPKFNSEGYIKIHARLKGKGLMVGKNRIYRLMKASNLLLQINGANGSGRKHDGTIITEAPNLMWATDGKEFQTREEGKCWFIGVIDHFNDEIKSFHVCKKFDRYAALEPLREAVKNEFGSLEKGICQNMDIALRSDHGSQFDSCTYQGELKFLGLNYSPAFVRSPECNGIIERFHRTLNEQIFKQEYFENLEEAKKALNQFIERYNQDWILHRLGLRSPLEYRIAYDKTA